MQKFDLSRLLLAIGVVFLFIGVGGMVFIYAPVIQEEAKFSLNQTKPKEELEDPAFKEFGLDIPKLKIRSKVIEGVNPLDSNEYQQKLALGVAHAKGTATPDKMGSPFLFAHSSQNLIEAQRYNSVFYLTYKLEQGDDVNLYYKHQEYKYKVIDKIVVEPEDTKYLENKEKNKLYLMTCYPPGTNFKRLIIVAQKI